LSDEKIPGVTVIQHDEVAFRPVQGDGATGLSMARLYHHPDGALTFQLARIEPGGISRRHAHPWEQINLVVEGRGSVEVENRRVEIGAGDCIIFEPNASHAITSTGDVPLLLVALLGPGAP
jgi:quercetin dioxygenase-like cupin family protein